MRNSFPDVDGDDEFPFTIIVGLSATLHLGSIVLSTIFLAALNRVYGAVDRHMMRIKLTWLLVISTTSNYIAILLLISAMVLAAQSRGTSDFEGAIYVMVLVVFILPTYPHVDNEINKFQEFTSRRFYEKHCDSSGRLHSHILERLYSAK